MAAYDTEIFSPTNGFGGNGKWVEIDSSQDPFGLAQFGRSGGGCVQDGPFTRPNFHVNIGEKDGAGQCLRRDFLPGIFNFFADPKTLEKTINEPDFAAFASTLEGRPSFSVSNVHGSGHFGVGGVLGQAGDAANSPGGKIPHPGTAVKQELSLTSHHRPLVLPPPQHGRLRLLAMAAKGPRDPPPPSWRLYHALGL